LDYHVVLVEDCAAARVRVMHDAAIWNFKYLYGNVATSVEILDAWRSLGIVV
jgi:nicotinamidase-related amidase